MNNFKSGNIIICGLGGQGTVLLSKIMGEFFLKKDYELKISDIVGVGRRGGSVLCYFRYSSSSIMSPLIKAGDADYLISFEQTETLRNLHFLKDDGVIFTSTYELTSPTINTGLEKDTIGYKLQILKNSGKEIFLVDVPKYTSMDPTLRQMSNVIMMGYFAGYIGFDEQEIIEVMKLNISPKYIENNINAFMLGKKIFSEQQ